MSTNQKSNRVTKQASYTALANGLTKHAATLPSFVVGGTTVKSSDVIASIAATNAAMDAVTPARAAWRVAVQAAQAQDAKTAPLVSSVKQTLRVMFAGQIDVLADFGETPRKTPATRTPEEKAMSVAKAQATRAARNTMGPVRKKQVKGTVTGVTVTTLVAGPSVPATGSPPTTASPVAAPAPAAVVTPAPRTTTST